MFNAGKIYVGEFTTVVELYSTDATNWFYRLFKGIDEQDGNHILTTIRFFHGAATDTRLRIGDSVEVETFVNSIDVSDGQGKEIIMRVSSEKIANEGVFYTDSNGLEM